ncbi:chemotaxis protein CheW [Lysobacter sp. BMK333-48F3]|uniref:chemotaxis protein CheW n=1 Tax=Lysobacter sp. BMK333-48F3 TaxID=2867962 RepID=UPI001C8B8EED|nr:chemotaxis protein CheW [Lysobacter sp. BMK333-48F3]MBX9403527.1 chemotaxis protein CheW [Lysobacter sp. BMK333-48F3]
MNPGDERGAIGSAVARLLERAPQAQDLCEATAEAAARHAGQAVLSGSAFLFRLGGEWLGLDSAVVDEVIEPRSVHSLPHRRDGLVRGLVNVRGRLTVCVALESLFQLDAARAQAPARRRLVVLAQHDQRLAFEADEVHGSHRYDPAECLPVPSTVAHSTSRFSTGVLQWSVPHRDGGAHAAAAAAGPVSRSVGLLDAELILSSINRRLG